ncbi:hypothetical protein CAC42_440 [Sphaceloma murrayae]|uniref:SMP-30/Gluconolactonase/LRE-like region domain-containing protein n=1 Tax=Sphaceloma murrayae TaxID=2082308 RepID=A0A2K1R3H1_9PEZI|nr:hypothetical protein CAC42_440 [Sphaceloma murrayae]
MADIKKYTITEPYLSLDAKLGEAPFWHGPTNTLRLVDIVRRHLHQIDLSAGPSSLRTFNLDDSVSTTAEIAGDGKKFVFGGKRGLGVMDRETGEWRYLKRYWGEEEVTEEVKEKVRRFRGNDGAVDARGRYFVGVMNDPLEGDIKEEGVLFRFDPDLSLHKILEPVAIPNGISWSLDNKFIYFTSSMQNRLTKYPYDIETGDIDLEAGQIFFQCPYEGGVPDGHARDAEGCFWIACYGVGKVVRVDEEGQILAEITLPARCVTCPAIADQDLIITSAEESDPDQYPESAENQGGVFKIHIGVKGAPLHEFRPTEALT